MTYSKHRKNFGVRRKSYRLKHYGIGGKPHLMSAIEFECPLTDKDVKRAITTLTLQHKQSVRTLGRDELNQLDELLDCLLRNPKYREAKVAENNARIELERMQYRHDTYGEKESGITQLDIDTAFKNRNKLSKKMDKLEKEYNENLIYHANTLRSVGQQPRWLRVWSDMENFNLGCID